MQLDIIIQHTIQCAVVLALVAGATSAFLPKRAMRIVIGIAVTVWLLIGVFVFLTQIIYK